MKVFKLGLWSFKVALDRVEGDFKKDNSFWSGAVSYAERSCPREKRDLKDKAATGVFEHN